MNTHIFVKDWYVKYLKYKSKYLKLKKQYGGYINQRTFTCKQEPLIYNGTKSENYSLIERAIFRKNRYVKQTEDTTEYKDLEDFCEKVQWNKDVNPTDTCKFIPLANMCKDTNNKRQDQIVIGRMQLLQIYYNCSDKYITLSTNKWSVSLNDLFIYCSTLNKKLKNTDFPIRLVTDDETFTNSDLECSNRIFDPIKKEYVEMYKGMTQDECYKHYLNTTVDIVKNLNQIKGILSLHKTRGITDGDFTNTEICELLNEFNAIFYTCKEYPYLFFISFNRNEYKIIIQDLNENGIMTYYTLIKVKLKFV